MLPDIRMLISMEGMMRGWSLWNVCGKSDFREDLIVVAIPFDKLDANAVDKVGDKVGDKTIKLNPTGRLGGNTLMEPHDSKPYNPDIARVFYRVGFY